MKLKKIVKICCASPNFKKIEINENNKKKQTQEKYKRMQPPCEASRKRKYHVKLEKQLKATKRLVNKKNIREVIVFMRIKLVHDKGMHRRKQFFEELTEKGIKEFCRGRR